MLFVAKLPWTFWKRIIVYITYVKGTVSRDFCFRFFSWITFPQAPDNTLGSFRIFSKIRGDIHKSRCTTGVNNTSGKFATGINDTGSKILPPVPLVLLTPVANLPPVLTIPAANLPPVSTTPVANCHRYQRHRWQIHNWNNIRLHTPESKLEGKN